MKDILPESTVSRRAMFCGGAAVLAAATGVPGGAASATASILTVGSALPDPPFDMMTASGPAGFDIDLLQLIARALQREWRLVRYRGSDFNGIFASLDSGEYDCVASGTTITPERQKVADFCAPYVLSGQSVAVDITLFH